jgi:hypothetical protein
LSNIGRTPCDEGVIRSRKADAGYSSGMYGTKIGTPARASKERRLVGALVRQ